MNSKFDQLESKLASLFEDQMMSILPGITTEDLVIQKLAVAIRKNIIDQTEIEPTAPNVITLIVAPESASKWKDTKVLDALKNVIVAAVDGMGIKFRAQLTITITTDKSFTEKDVSVITSHKLETVEDTMGMNTDVEKDNEENAIPANAFLIVEGVKVHPLKETVVNIGRRLENNLVIDDPRISRNHAQLRAIKGRFVLFDLNSTGGSFVNGQRTSQTVLYPGDVISLAGVALIFGQDNPPPRPDLKDTSPFNDKSTDDRPTASLDQTTANLKTDKLTKDKRRR